MPRATYAKAEGMRILALSDKQRLEQHLPLTDEDLCEYLNVHWSSVSRWKQELGNFREKLQKSAEAIEKSKPKKVNDEVDFRAVYDSLMFMAVNKHNAFAAKLLLEVMGRLTTKQEVTVIDGSLITRAAIKASRELREQGYGVDEVPKKLTVLRPKLRLPAGQGKRANAKV